MKVVKRKVWLFPVIGRICILSLSLQAGQLKAQVRQKCLSTRITQCAVLSSAGRCSHSRCEWISQPGVQLVHTAPDRFHENSLMPITRYSEHTAVPQHKCYPTVIFYLHRTLFFHLRKKFSKMSSVSVQRLQYVQAGQGGVEQLCPREAQPVSPRIATWAQNQNTKAEDWKSLFQLQNVHIWLFAFKRPWAMGNKFVAVDAIATQ